MKHIKDHYKEISKFFESEDLISLSDNEYNYNGINTMEIIKLEKSNSNFKKFNKFKNIRDLINCNNDLKYFTANLFLYNPYINNPINEFVIFENKKIYTYHQNGPDWIYSMFISCCYETPMTTSRHTGA